MTPDELPAMWTRIIDKFTVQGADAAVRAMGQVYYKHLVDVTLVRYSHPRDTWTTSPAGQPPAVVSGALRRSVRRGPVVRTGPLLARMNVGPHIVYARIQDQGGVVHAKNPHYEYIINKRGNRQMVLKGTLHFRVEGTDYFPLSVRIPRRPYMRPALRDVIRDGSMQRAAARAVRELWNG